MIDLTPTLIQAQIAFGIAIIAFVLVFHVFNKDIDKMLRKGKRNRNK